MPYCLRDLVPSDLEAITRMNAAEIPNVSPFAPGELQRLAAQAVYFRVAEAPNGGAVAFLLALDETAVYESLNFKWFKARYPQFTYVDRIVVAASAQSKGLGRLLYSDLRAAVTGRSPWLSCEVNLRPANPKSLLFHQRLGFREVGTQDTEGGKKTVALLAMELGANLRGL